MKRTQWPLEALAQLIDEDGNRINVQNPLPVDGDSIYEKDLDIDLSDIGTFLPDDIGSLFDNTQNEIADGTATDPKTFTLVFHRPISTSSIGIATKTGDFSNVKLIMKTVAGDTRHTIDDSSNDTKYTSQLYAMVPQTFDTLVVEFHTADAVDIAGMTIPKIQSRSISSIEGFVSIVNSTDVPLLADEVFEGDPELTVNYGIIVVSTYSEVASADDGLSLEQSTDGTNWDHIDVFTIAADTGKTFSLQPAAKWFRVIYTNGGDPQVAFRLQTQFKPVYVKPSSHRVLDSISGQDDAELVKANLTARSLLTGLFENISSYRETLNVNNAWVNRKIVNETFHQHTGTTTVPTSPISEGDISINFTSVAGFAVGSEIKLEEGTTQEIGLLTITDITVLVVTVDRPIGNDYTTAADINEVVSNMAVSGTLASPEIFEIDPPPLTIWQFTRILFAITDGTAPDDGKFGGMAALTNGVSLRATTSAGRTVVFANWKNNGDMKLDMFDVPYTDKAPAGNHGVNGRWTFTKAEVVAELDGDASPVQKLEVLIQDDLTDLVTFKMRGQGRVFSP